MNRRHTTHEIHGDSIGWIPTGDLSMLQITDMTGRQLVWLSDPSRQLALQAIWDAVIEFSRYGNQPGVFLRIEAYAK